MFKSADFHVGAAVVMKRGPGRPPGHATPHRRSRWIAWSVVGTGRLTALAQQISGTPGIGGRDVALRRRSRRRPRVCDPTLALQRQSGGLARDHQFFIGWNDKAGQTRPFSDAAIAVLPVSFTPSLVDLGMKNREMLEHF